MSSEYSLAVARLCGQETEVGACVVGWVQVEEVTQVVKDAATSQALKETVDDEVRRLRQQHAEGLSKLEDAMEADKAKQRATLQARLAEKRAKFEADAADKALRGAEKEAMMQVRGIE